MDSMELAGSSGPSLKDRLLSIKLDSDYVAAVVNELMLPAFANLHCGAWYISPGPTAYFKSTDGHAGKEMFSLSRLNLHVALAAATSDGCILVDSSRHKPFPDAFTRTIPIWCCTINRALKLHREQTAKFCAETEVQTWDCTLFMHDSVSEEDKAGVEKQKIGGFVSAVLSSGVDLSTLAGALTRPLRPVWISARDPPPAAVELVESVRSQGFTPVVCLCASAPPSSPSVPTEEASFPYVPGAADDEDNWSCGLSAEAFWQHRDALTDVSLSLPALTARILSVVAACRAKSGRTALHRKVAFAAAQRGKLAEAKVEGLALPVKEEAAAGPGSAEAAAEYCEIGDTGYALGIAAECPASASPYAALIFCDTRSAPHPPTFSDSKTVLKMSIQDDKRFRYALTNSLGDALAFAARFLATCSEADSKVAIVSNDGGAVASALLCGMLLGRCHQPGSRVAKSMLERVDQRRAEAAAKGAVVPYVEQEEIRAMLATVQSFLGGRRAVFPSRQLIKQVARFFQLKERGQNKSADAAE